MELTTNNVQAFAINQTTWELTPISGETHLTDKRTHSITFDPTGKYLFVMNGGDGEQGSSISVFLINPLTGKLGEVPGSPFGTSFSTMSTKFVYTIR